MATQKKFPVAEFIVRGGVLKQAQRNALVRSAMTGALSGNAQKDRSASKKSNSSADGLTAKKTVRKGK